uniref:Uncharacterized protein n=1 Tax=Aegilops tauschii TaxID=37682 RepID=R7W4E8_AEGTA
MEQDAPPVPSHQAQDDGAVDGWARDGTESPLPYGAPAECPEAADPPPLLGYVSSVARARPSTSVRALQPSVRNLWIVLSSVSDLRIHGCWQAAVGGALRRHAPATLHPQESHMDWGYVPRFGFKGAIFEHLYINYRGSQVDMDRTMIKCILVL